MILVSGIMPTRGRRQLAKRALESFLSQDYLFKELIILDDADDPSFELEEINSSIVKYWRAYTRWTISQKRNECCKLAAGQIIVHFDSDDWSAPNRISEQVETLNRFGRAVTGYSTMLFFDGQRWGLFDNPAVAIGTSLCYRRDYWEQNPFPSNLKIGEDNEFVRIAKDNRQLIAVEGRSMMVARVHRGNTSPKLMEDFNVADLSIIPAGFSS